MFRLMLRILAGMNAGRSIRRGTYPQLVARRQAHRALRRLLK